MVGYTSVCSFYCCFQQFSIPYYCIERDVMDVLNDHEVPQSFSSSGLLYLSFANILRKTPLTTHKCLIWAFYGLQHESHTCITSQMRALNLRFQNCGGIVLAWVPFMNASEALKYWIAFWSPEIFQIGITSELNHPCIFWRIIGGSKKLLVSY